MDPSARSRAKAVYSNHRRWHPEDEETLLRLKRESIVAELAYSIERLMAECPPLTNEQKYLLIRLIDR